MHKGDEMNEPEKPSQEPVTVGSECNDMLGEAVLLFTGKAYNRPCGRGICLGEDLQPLEDLLPEGYFYIQIQAHKINAYGQIMIGRIFPKVYT